MASQIFLIQQAQAMITCGGGYFLNGEGINEFPWHGFRADGEIHHGALRLRPPIAVFGNLHRAKRVAFLTMIAHGEGSFLFF